MSPGFADGAITVDPTQRFQKIDGFGFALTDSAAYLIDQVPNDTGQRTAVLRELFDPTAGIGVSWMRIVMAASDFTLTPRPWYSYRPTEADSFDVNRPRPGSPAGDNSHIIPLLQQARALSGGQVFFFANPHSAPGWMKGNGDMWNLGGDGCLLGYCPNSPRDVRDQYTQYFADFVRTYEAAGIPIDALGVQNEPGNVTDYPGGNLRRSTNGQTVQPAAVYTTSDQLDFISRLKAKLTTSGLSQTPKLWAELNSWEATSKIAGSADPGSVDGLSYHCYFYAKGGLDDFHAAFPDKSIDETECTQVTPAGNIPTTTEVLFDAMQHFASSGSNWNLALDPTGGPQATCSSSPDQCGTHGSDQTAPVTITGPPGQATATLTREYYEMGQFSKFVRPGAVRIGSSQLDGVASVAFQNPDGSRVAVVHNTRTTSVDLAVNLGDGRHINPVTLQPDESSTFTWT